LTDSYIQKSLKIYQDAASEYQRYYFDINTGGFVLIHQDHNITSSEQFVAKILANQGNQVKLLSEKWANEGKIPDAEIDDDLWEFKELTNAINVRGAVQRDIRDGKKQASNIVYHINQPCDRADINQGIASAIRMEQKKLILKIILIFPDGTYKLLTREEIENGQSF
jgi:hypothetical protein